MVPAWPGTSHHSLLTTITTPHRRLLPPTVVVVVAKRSYVAARRRASAAVATGHSSLAAYRRTSVAVWPLSPQGAPPWQRTAELRPLSPQGTPPWQRTAELRSLSPQGTPPWQRTAVTTPCEHHSLAVLRRRDVGRLSAALPPSQPRRLASHIRDRLLLQTPRSKAHNSRMLSAPSTCVILQLTGAALSSTVHTHTEQLHRTAPVTEHQQLAHSPVTVQLQ